jgi:hypothetical protein
MAITKGIMGFVRLPGAGLVRVTSFGLKATQEIQSMDTVDATWDYTAYRYGPIKVEGDVALPIPSGENILLDVLDFVSKRSPNTGRLTNAGPIEAAYDHTLAYRYTGCQANTASFSIQAEEAIDLGIGFIGAAREIGSVAIDKTSSFFQPRRVLTWDDVTFGGNIGDESATIADSCQVRSFNFEINNNVTAFYGLCGDLFTIPENIVAGKREVSGTFEAAWGGGFLFQNYAYQTNSRGDDTTTDELSLDVRGNGIVRFPGVIFNMEEINITNDFFVGTQSWRAYGTDGTNAIEYGTD